LYVGTFAQSLDNFFDDCATALYYCDYDAYAYYYDGWAVGVQF